MERDEDAGKAEPPISAVALVEAMVESGVEEIYVEPNVHEKLEAECAPLSIEEYFDVPIYVIRRH